MRSSKLSIDTASKLNTPCRFRRLPSIDKPKTVKPPHMDQPASKGFLVTRNVLLHYAPNCQDKLGTVPMYSNRACVIGGIRVADRHRLILVYGLTHRDWTDGV